LGGSPPARKKTLETWVLSSWHSQKGMNDIVKAFSTEVLNQIIS
jgi:hypothetical protein